MHQLLQNQVQGALEDDRTDGADRGATPQSSDRAEELSGSCIAAFLGQVLIQTTRVYFFAGRKNPQLILNNYVYTRHSKPSDRTYWECRSKKDSRCKSRITSKGNKIFFGEEHNHMPPSVNFTGLPFRSFLVVHRNKSEPDFHTFYYNMLRHEVKVEATTPQAQT
ncbi:hypothetical protein HUJ04_010929 [Dendroctonus ponderosae]|nr:hypothetical protein HUJ04_010929 [Dendroctonus ponderosae]KAH1028209.1 hypothetical protein HUJ05_001584 [Dendroctonus ponderosae]